MNDNRDDVLLTDIDPVKKTILTGIRKPGILTLINDFRIIMKRQKRNMDDTIRYSADPIIELLYPLYEEIINDFYEPHVQEALRDGVLFLLYLISCDSAYRPGRNKVLHRLLEPENINKFRKALEKEREITDYMNPDKWYDNMKWLACNKTRKMKREGKIPSKRGAMCIEELEFHDAATFQNIKKQIERR